MKAFPVLTLRPVDDYGEPLPTRVTGVEVVADEYADYIVSYEVAKVWHMTPDDFQLLPASAWLRRVALHRAAAWDQPTMKTININRDKRRM